MKSASLRVWLLPTICTIQFCVLICLLISGANAPAEKAKEQQEIVFRDSKGKVRMKLGLAKDKEWPGIGMYDAEGNLGIVIAVQDKGAVALFRCNGDKLRQVEIAATKDDSRIFFGDGTDSFLRLVSNDDENILQALDPFEEPKVTIGCTKTEPILNLMINGKRKVLTDK